MKPLSLLFFLIGLASASKQWTVSPSLELSKSHNYHWNNGFGTSITHQNLPYLTIRARYISSRLGSALSSFALEEDYYLTSLMLHTRPSTWFNLYIELETGYYSTSIPEKEFQYLETASSIFNAQLGLQSHIQVIPAGIDLYLGYQVFQGANNLFPLFTGLRLWYNFSL